MCTGIYTLLLSIVFGNNLSLKILTLQLSASKFDWTPYCFYNKHRALTTIVSFPQKSGKKLAIDTVWYCIAATLISVLLYTTQSTILFGVSAIKTACWHTSQCIIKWRQGGGFSSPPPPRPNHCHNIFVYLSNPYMSMSKVHIILLQYPEHMPGLIRTHVCTYLGIWWKSWKCSCFNQATKHVSLPKAT